METRVAEQFGYQMLAISSLRTMIVDTDILLERVLSRLESSPGGTDEQFAGSSLAGSSDDEPIISLENASQENLRSSLSTPTGKKPVSTLAY